MSIQKRQQSLKKSTGRIILGVDPGTLVTGYGLIEHTPSGVGLVAYDIIRNQQTESLPLRLKRIYDTLCGVIEAHHPTECAIETAYYGKNVQSALKLGHARGVVMLVAAQYGVPTTEYTPREVKRAVTGNGAASKKKVHYMVRALLRLSSVPRHFDESDALALALCHSLRTGTLPLQSRQDRTNWAAYVKEHPEKVVTLL